MEAETKSGYKMTEVGLIPEDWYDLTFKDICWVNQGLQIPISQRLILPNKSSKIYITIQYLNDGKTIEYIDDYVPSVCCNKEDILMTRTGNTGIVVTGVEGVFHNNFFKINLDKNKFDKDYIVNYLNQPKTKKTILAKAGTSTIPDLNHKDFYSIAIPIPPTKNEQTAIANALKDTDDLINSLENLIAKKKLIKQGTMQELLKPKKGWVKKKLGEVLVYEQPTQYLVQSTEYNDNNPIPVLTAGKGLILGYTDENTNIYNNLPVIIFDDFTTSSHFINFPFKMKSSAMKLLRLKDRSNNNLKFIFEILKKVDYMVSDHKRHWIGEFQKLEILVPTIDEQNKVASIIFNFDIEIESLEFKLSKLQTIKQGMMQQLLTGKIRLLS